MNVEDMDFERHSAPQRAHVDRRRGSRKWFFVDVI